MEYIMKITNENQLSTIREYNEAVTDFKYPNLYGSLGDQAGIVRAKAHRKATNLRYVINAMNDMKE